MHGGSAPQVRAAARRRLAERAALASIADQVVAPIDDPLEALADITAQAVALKDFLASRVAELTSLAAAGVNDADQVRAVVILYERALDRSAKFLSAWVGLGLDERRVQLSERQAEILADVIRVILSETVAVLRGAVDAGEVIDAAWVERVEHRQMPEIARSALELAAVRHAETLAG